MAAMSPMPLIPDTPPQSVETLGPSPTIAAPRFGNMEAQPDADVQIVDRGYNSGAAPSPFDTLTVPKPMPKIPIMMKVMAGAAALKGNPGPMMQLMQQERSMEAFNSIIPHVAKANRLTSQGKHAEAEEVLTGLAPQIGIAPEIKEFIQPMLEKIYESQKATQYADTVVAGLKLEAARQQDNPKQLATVKAMIEVAKQGRNLTSQKHFMDYMAGHQKSFHLDTNSKSGIVTTPSGSIEQVPIPQTFENDILKTAAGQKLTSDLGLPAHVVQNIANGIPVMVGDKNITPAMKPIIDAAIAKLPGFEAQRTLAKDTPWIPERTQAYYDVLIEKGVPVEQVREIIATHGGNLPSNVLADLNRAVDDRIQGRRINEALAPLKAQDMVPLESSPNNKDQVAIGQEKGTADWARRIPGVSRNDVINSNGKMGTIDKNILRDEIVPAKKALDALAMVPEMMASAGRPEGDVERFSTGLGRAYARWAGTSDPKAAKLEAASVMLSRAIEVALGTQAIKTEDAPILKKLVSQPFTSEGSALAAVKELQNALERNIQQYMDSNVKIEPRPGPQPKATMGDLSKAGAIKPVTIKGEKRGVSATYQPYPSSSIPEVKAVQETVNGLIADRLKIPGQKALKGDYVSDKDSLLVARQKLADANVKMLELQRSDNPTITTPGVAAPEEEPAAPQPAQAVTIPSGGTLHFNKAKRAQ